MNVHRRSDGGDSRWSSTANVVPGERVNDSLDQMALLAVTGLGGSGLASSPNSS